MQASNVDYIDANDDDDDDDDDETEQAYEKATIKELNPEKKENIAEGVFEYTFGEHTEQTELLPEKAIMVIGGTGKGKSTLINRMINHIFRVEYADPFRYLLVQEKEMSQTQSQTRDITKYTLLNLKTFKLIIIDTPGIGDTAGKREDQNTIEKIRKLFTSGTIETIRAICFVAKHNDVRLDAHVRYVFQETSQLFGSDTESNIFVMATCCDATYDEENKIERAPVLKLFKKAKIPFKEDQCFSFNNKNIYKKPEISGRIFDREQDDWKTSAISFDCFFEALQKTRPVSLVLTTDIMETRHQIIHVKLPMFIRQLKDQIHLLDEHKENLKVIEKEIENPTQDFTYEVEIERIIQEDIIKPGIFCTKCKKCDKVCHDPCDIRTDDGLHWCDTMSWFNWQFRIYCTACPKQCSYKDHIRDTKRPVRRTVRETRTLEDLKVKYVKEKSDSRDNLVKLIEYEMITAYNDMLKHLEGIQECTDYINKNCLSKKPVTLESYINDTINDETHNQEDGYLKRIKVLKNLMISMQGANKQKINIFQAFKQASTEDKLQQAKQCYKD